MFSRLSFFLALTASKVSAQYGSSYGGSTTGSLGEPSGTASDSTSSTFAYVAPIRSITASWTPQTTLATTVMPTFSSLVSVTTLASSPTSMSSSTPTSPTNSSSCKNIQYPFPPGTNANDPRAQAIREAYVRSWNAYDEYAFGNDQLFPLNRSFTNPWNHWGVTIVDGMDTAIVMNLTDIVAKQLAFIPTIDFTSSPDQLVEIFDINIRYVGGLLGAYDLLHSSLFPNTYDQSDVDALLTQAVILSNGLALAYDTPTGLPAGNVNLTTKTLNMSTYEFENVTYNATNTAQAGTFILEWFRLSDLTGDETFRQLAERSESYLVNPNPAPAYPGLVGTELNTETGEFITFDGGWHSGVDSFLEYLIKSYIYNPMANISTAYLNFWLEAVQSTEQNIALHPYGFPAITWLSSLSTHGEIQYGMDDFACFAGGNLLLGGAYLNRPDISALGVAITDGCHATYNTTITGLGPLEWAWYNSSNQAFNPNNDVDNARRQAAAKNGYFITDYNWNFRPESIESIFYAYRITGDPIWQEYAWQIFLAINETASNEVAVAEVANVNAPFGQRQLNNIESFWFAEVLKYLYLTFTPPDVVSLDTFVFNTEAHPLLIQTGTCATE